MDSLLARRIVLIGKTKEDYIVFVDPVVEQICATTWGDGIGIKPSQAAQASIGTTFKGNTDITSFDELRYFKPSGIESYAFQGCTSLESVTFPSGIGYLQQLFNGCSSLKELTILGNRGTGHLSFAGYCFIGCNNLTRVNVPSLDVWMLRGFANTPTAAKYGPFDASMDGHVYIDGVELTNLVIPEGKTTIDQGQFRYVKGVVSVTFPTTLVESQGGAFMGCSNIARLDVTDFEKYLSISFISNNSHPFCDTSGGSMYINGIVLNNLTLLSNVTTIKQWSFIKTTSITTLYIPHSVTSIGYGAFYECTGITGDVVVPQDTTINNEAFRNCTGITNLIILKPSVSIAANHFMMNTGNSTGTLYVKNLTCSQRENQFKFKHIIIDGDLNYTTNGGYFSYAAVETIRIKGNASLAHGLHRNTAKSVRFVEFMGTVSPSRLLLDSVNGYAQNAILHLGYNGIAASPQYLYDAKLSKIYVGPGESQSGDQAVLNTYLADTDWSAYSSKLDLWSNYKGIYRYDLNGWGYVDLGLPSGTFWCDCNIGATLPQQFGDYFAWGGIYTKTKYDWSTYEHGTENNPTKYNTTDNKTELDPGDDAAFVLMGGNWHLPTQAQCEELLAYTTASNTTVGGVAGLQLTSTVNGNTIFFPYSGIYYLSDTNGAVGEGFGGWASTRSSDKSQAFMYNGNASGSGSTDIARAVGVTSRGVLSADTVTSVVRYFGTSKLEYTNGVLSSRDYYYIIVDESTNTFKKVAMLTERVDSTTGKITYVADPETSFGPVSTALQVSEGDWVFFMLGDATGWQWRPYSVTVGTADSMTFTSGSDTIKMDYIEMTASNNVTYYALQKKWVNGVLTNYYDNIYVFFSPTLNDLKSGEQSIIGEFFHLKNRTKYMK